jgi:hypothetical protein
MSAIEEVMGRREVMPYVRFERVAVEDVAASKVAGHYMARDVDQVWITPPYSKDLFKKNADEWFEQLKSDVQNGRVPPEWVEKCRKLFEAWKAGQELPPDGTPIRGWGLISPAQQDVLLRMNIFTLEDLACINDEGLRRIGMGAVDMKNKAVAALTAARDVGPVVLENADLRKRLDLSEANVGQLTDTVKELQNIVRAIQGAQAAQAPISVGITASDLEDEPPKRGKKG